MKGDAPQSGRVGVSRFRSDDSLVPTSRVGTRPSDKSWRMGSCVRFILIAPNCPRGLCPATPCGSTRHRYHPSGTVAILYAAMLVAPCIKVQFPRLPLAPNRVATRPFGARRNSVLCHPFVIKIRKGFIQLCNFILIGVPKIAVRKRDWERGECQPKCVNTLHSPHTA